MESRLTCKNFQPLTCRAIIFTPDEEASVPKIMKLVVNNWTEVFDAEPNILDIQNQISLPREIPKITLTNKTNSFVCEISSASVTILIRTLDPNSQDFSVSEFVDKATRLLIEYKDKLNARVGRLSSIIERIALVENPALFLAAHFCKERSVQGQPFNRPENFEIHAHKTYDMTPDFRVNSWVRNVTRDIMVGPVQRRVILVLQDINTLSEAMEKADYSNDNIKGFFSNIPINFDEVLSHYYPEGE